MWNEDSAISKDDNDKLTIPAIFKPFVPALRKPDIPRWKVE